MTAYERRYLRQLRDVGVATAIAQHDPAGLDKAFGSSTPAAADARYDRSRKWW